MHTVTRGMTNSGSDAIEGDLQRRLLEAVSQAAHKSIAVEQILSVVRDDLPKAEVAYLDRNESKRLSFSQATGLLEKLPLGAEESLQPWAAQTCESGTTTIHQLAGAHQWVVVFTPVMFRDQPPEVLVAAFRKDATTSTRVAGTLALAASHLTLWSTLQEVSRWQRESKTAAALVELSAQLDDSKDLSAAYYLLVNELREYLDCSRIVLGLSRRGRIDCRINAISGLSGFDKRSEYVRQLEATLNEAIVRDTTTVVSADGTSHDEGTLAHQKLIAGNLCRRLISSPLYDGGGEAVGAWLFVEDQFESDPAKTLAFVRASQSVVGTRLSLLQRTQGSPLLRPLRACFEEVGTRKWTFLMVCVVIIVATMFIPTDYKISCDCQLEPVRRRYVAAPYDGTLEESMVEAGQIVNAGEVLARMDARELRWQLSGLEADRESERKKRDAAAARDEVAVSQQSDLEIQRINLQIQLIEHRLENLEVKSPIDGVVITGDLKKSEGVPLTIGQTMFEIGPLDKMIVEVAIPEREILYVQAEMAVEIRLEAAQRETGKITRISPRSEIRDRSSVYIAEVELDNRDGAFRPGMKGNAKIISDPHPIGWNLFHKAWESLAMLIGC